MTTPQLSLKLLINTKSNKVLFAEAGKDVVDFLFSLLSMPVGSIIKLLNKEKMGGCIANLYKSVENLDLFYILSKQKKTLLLNPTTAASSPLKNTLFLTEESPTTVVKKFYRCSYTGYSECRTWYTDDPGTRCPYCNSQMTVEMRYVVPSAETAATAAAVGGRGFVKGVVTYTVTDDLTVTPMSTISCIALLKKLRVKEVGSLEECTVTLGMKDVSKISKLLVSLLSIFICFEYFVRLWSCSRLRCSPGRR